MANRKLQSEIERTLKRVAEGVDVFEGIFDKIQTGISNSNTATSQPQKEKLETELKKEIKKLQRFRDQIKTWAALNEIKDKKALVDNRKLIETQMEKFKAMERELKTKAYSQAGLNAASKIDPEEVEKEELRQWISDIGDKLSAQIDMFEAEMETLRISGKKSKRPVARNVERTAKIAKGIERHKHHQTTMEIVLRMLDNGNLGVDEVKNIQEDVTFYVDDNQNPEFIEDEGIYDSLNLDEGEAYGFGNDDDDDDTESTETPQTPPRMETPIREEPKKRPSKSEKDIEDMSTPPRKVPPREKETVKKIALPIPKPALVAARPTAPALVEPVILTQQYAKAAALNTPKFIVETVKGSPFLIIAVPKPTSVAAPPSTPEPFIVPHPPKVQQQSHTPHLPPKVAETLKIQRHPTPPIPIQCSEPVPTIEPIPEVKMSHLLADLAAGFDAIKIECTFIITKAQQKTDITKTRMLEASYFHVPEAIDSSKPGTLQQYLAALELKRQSWRFHKKFLTWFQRHEEPKSITEEYEEGTYIYFDYEEAWCQRKKADFRFEYRFLEDDA